MHFSNTLDSAARSRLIAVARGDEPADLLVENVRLVNVLSGEIHETHVAMAEGVFTGFGPCPAMERLDAGGRFMCPGLIDGHIHLESSFLSPPEFARAVAAHGTAACVCGPHEIANVLGPAGIEYMLKASSLLPVTLYFMMPSCVPASHLETSGAAISAEDISRFLAAHPGRMLGLGEMMNYPGVLARDPEILARIEAAGGLIVDGHAPLLTGRDLGAYVLAGPTSDHESVDAQEAGEKLRAGMFLMIREGSTERNLADLLPVVNEFNASRTCFVSDDRSAATLSREGHLDQCVRKAVRLGVPPVRAVQMASINTATRYGLRGRGAIAPGYRADFVLLNDLESFDIASVHLCGRPIEFLDFNSNHARPPISTMHAAPATPETFRIPLGKGRARVIGFIEGQIVTKSLLMEPREENGHAVADPGRDMAKLAVIERHTGSGNVGLGFINGLGLTHGALATSVAHDAHNLIVAGVDDRDMALAANRVLEMGGGMAVVVDGGIAAAFPLPVAGLMSEAPWREVAVEFEALLETAKQTGTPLESPFAALSFMALSVIPSLKLTDLGLVDVEAFALTPLFEGQARLDIFTARSYPGRMTASPNPARKPFALHARPESLPGVEILHARHTSQRFARHFHECYALGVIENGVLGFDYMGEHVAAPAGSVNLAVPGEPHTGQAETPEGWTYRMFYLDPGLLADAARQIGNRRPTPPHFAGGVIRDPELAARIRGLHILAGTGQAPRMVLETGLLRLLSAWILRHAEERPPLPGAIGVPARMARIRDLIADRCAEDLSLETLARSAGLSPFHLVRSFTRHMGLAPHEYLIQCRIERAKALLARGTAIADAAMDLGFADQSHFTRHFKRLTGVTPGKWKAAFPGARSFKTAG